MKPGQIDWSDVEEEPILFSRGARLSDVPISFNGISFHRWWMRSISEQCSAYVRTALPETEAARTDWKPGRLF